MTQSRTELINIVGRILASGDWDNPDIDNCDIGSKEDVRAYAEEIVTALRPEAASPTGMNVPDDMWDNTVSGAPYKPCYDISPKSEILRACDHRQCPPDKCQGC